MKTVGKEYLQANITKNSGMGITTGVDIVQVSDFEKNLKISSGLLLENIFHEEETAHRDIESLAGIFAAKEALIKTGLIGVGEWLKVKILNNSSGRPEVYNEVNGKWTRTETTDISISHAGDYAVASAVYIRN